MTRTTGLPLAFALLLSVGSVATAQHAPEPHQVVERFTASVSAGDRPAAFALLSQGAV